MIHDGGAFGEPIIEVQEVQSGKDDTEEVEQTVGFAYFGQYLWALCEGPIRHLDSFYRNGHLVFSDFTPSAPQGGDVFFAQTGEVAEDKGSWTGPSAIVFMDGAQTNTGSYAARTGDPVLYKRTALMWMDGVFLGDNVGSVPPWSAVVSAYWNYLDDDADIGLSGDGNDAGKAQVAGSANAADVLWDMLVNVVGVSPDEIDRPSFQAAQTAMFDEGLGLCVLIEEAVSADEAIKEVLRHVDGILFRSHKTGLLTFRLFRDDFDVEDLQTLDESAYRNLKVSRQSWSEVFTEYTVKTVDPQTWKFSPYHVIDSAGRLKVGRHKPKVLSFPWIADTTMAGLLATRQRKRLFYPLAAIQLEVAKSVMDAEPGDVFLLDSEILGFEGLVCRVVGSEGGEGGEEWIQVEATEDLWGLGNATPIELPPTEPASPDYTLPDALDIVDIADAHQELAARKTIAVLAAPPDDDRRADRYAFQVNGRSLGSAAFCGTATLDAAYSGDTDWLDDETEILLENPRGLEEFSHSREAWQRLATKAVFLATSGPYEIVSIRELEDNEDGTWTARGIIRGVAGTEPATHGVGARLWILPESGLPFHGLGRLAATPTSEPLLVDVRAFNPVASSPATVVYHAYGYTAETPYPPAFLAVERTGSDATISWRARTRHKGFTTSNVADWRIPPDGEPIPTEGLWEVTSDQGFGPVVVDVPTVENIGAAVVGEVYSVRSLFEGRYSDPMTVESP